MWWPSERRALDTCAPELRDTSRSALGPPSITVILSFSVTFSGNASVAAERGRLVPVARPSSQSRTGTSRPRSAMTDRLCSVPLFDSISRSVYDAIGNGPGRRVVPADGESGISAPRWFPGLAGTSSITDDLHFGFQINSALSTRAISNQFDQLQNVLGCGGAVVDNEIGVLSGDESTADTGSFQA